MGSHIGCYTDTGKSRDEFDRALPREMSAYTAFRKAVHKDGGLNHKTKCLIALALRYFEST